MESHATLLFRTTEWHVFLFNENVNSFLLMDYMLHEILFTKDWKQRKKLCKISIALHLILQQKFPSEQEIVINIETIKSQAQYKILLL